MAIIKSGATSDNMTVDPISKAARITLYDSAGRELSIQNKQTFVIASTFTPAATPTDLVIIEGSATKTIRIISMKIWTTNTAAGSQSFQLIKRSTADTTGTFVSAGTPVAMDSNNAASTVSRVGHFTANPGALGTAIGTMSNIRVASPAAIPATWAGITPDSGIEMLDWMDKSTLDQPIVLRGIAQCLAINFNGAALVAGQTHSYRILWIEE